MTLPSQNIKYIRLVFSKMKNVEDFLAVVNYAKSLIITESSFDLDKFKGIEELYYHQHAMMLKALAPFSLNLLENYANHNNPNIERYGVFTIKKKSGGNRRINAPIGDLKLIQRCLNIIFQSLLLELWGLLKKLRR